MRAIIAYWTMLGCAMQSSRFEQEMNIKLLQIEAKTRQALFLEEEAERSEALAVDHQEKATEDEARAKSLEEQASLHFALSEQDETLATEAQIESEALALKAAEEETLAEEAFGLAEVDEATFDADIAEGAAYSAEVAQLEAEAEVDEVGIALCNCIPFLDIVCDVVGGVTVVGTNIVASIEASKSALEYVAAAAAKADEEEQLTVAAEQETKSIQDGESAANKVTEMTELQTIAQEELDAGEDEEAMAEEKEEQAAVEEQAAAREQAEFTANQAESQKLLGETLLLGVEVCWDALLAGSMGAMVLLYFSFRVITVVIVPGLVISYEALDLSSLSSMKPKISYIRNASHCLHHAAIFVLLMGIFGGWLIEMNQLNLRGRGGTVLLFSLSATLVQVILLHSLPFLCSISSTTTDLPTVLSFSSNLAKRFVTLFVLFIMEFLLLWVNVGKSFCLAPKHLQVLELRWLWLFFMVTVAAHIYFLELLVPSPKREFSDCMGQQNDREIDSKTVSLVYDEHNSREVMLISELSSLLSADHQYKQTQPRSQYPIGISNTLKVPTYGNSGDATNNENVVSEVESSLVTESECCDSWSSLLHDNPLKTTKQRYHNSNSSQHQTEFFVETIDRYEISIHKEFEFLLFLFEALVLSCMASLLRNCLPNVSRLWHASKSLFLVSRPTWLIPATVVMFIICLLWFILEIYLQLQRRRGPRD